MTLYLNAFGIVNPLGANKTDVARNLFAGSQAGLVENNGLIPTQKVFIGQVGTELPEIPDSLPIHKSRNNQLALQALLEIQAEVRDIISQYGADRIGVVVGTSTSGIGDNEAAIAQKVENGSFPDDYHYQRQATSDLSSFIQTYLNLNGPAMTISTACTSGAKAVASGARLIECGVCDAVIVGGADSLCGLTLNGFNALESLSSGKCLPFSRNRDGINIGEGAALFILSRNPGPIEICGFGETSDAYHISAPSPDGEGAQEAMKQALKGNDVNDVAYVNLHGTATRLNDAMESKAVKALFGEAVPCSSTKSLTGHMLGAAGANELGFLCLSITHGLLPPHVWDEEVDDDEIGPLNLVKPDCSFDPDGKVLISNSFAFGGNNFTVAVKKGPLS